MPPSPSRPKNPDRLKAERFGRRAEAQAELLLRLKLYHILKRRYKTPLGEIDLIAERFGTLVFVEVKARRPGAGEAEPLHAVNSARILRAARYFLMQHPRLANRAMRFDVILAIPGHWPRHLRNVFQG